MNPARRGIPAEAGSRHARAAHRAHGQEVFLVRAAKIAYQTTMAHAEGWIEAYEALAEGSSPSAKLLETVRSNRNGIGETMLHWYAIEGEPAIVEKIIGLGFDVNTTNAFGRPPLFECVQLDRWNMVELLLAHGARTDIRDHIGEDVFIHLKDSGQHAKAKKLKELIRRQQLEW